MALSVRVTGAESHLSWLEQNGGVFSLLGENDELSGELLISD